MQDMGRYHSQPIDFRIMCESHYKLINYPINTDSPTYQFILGIWGVVENEMVAIESGELITANPARHLQTMRQPVELRH